MLCGGHLQRGPDQLQALAGFTTGAAPGAAAGLTPQSSPAWPEDSDPQYWDFIRDQFHIPSSQAFFNTGTIGAVPRPVLERAIEDMRTLAATLPFRDYNARTPDCVVRNETTTSWECAGSCSTAQATRRCWWGSTPSRTSISGWAPSACAAPTLRSNSRSGGRMRPRSQCDPLGVRQSCHIHNSEDEIDATLEIMRDLTRQHA